MNVIQKIKSISDTLECQFIYDSLVKRIQKIQRKSIVIGVLGAANAGKSSIINALAGTSLPTSFLSSMQSNFVSFKNEGMSVVISSSEWMKTLQISFLEKVEKMFSCESEDIEYATYFADFDSCLYIIDAQMAYTKNDALIIEHLKKLGIPTLVCVSKYEKLSPKSKLIAVQTTLHDRKRYFCPVAIYNRLSGRIVKILSSTFIFPSPLWV